MNILIIEMTNSSRENNETHIESITLRIYYFTKKSKIYSYLKKNFMKKSSIYAKKHQVKCHVYEKKKPFMKKST